MALGAARREPVGTKLCHQVQDDQGGDPLAARRNLVDRVPAIVRRDRADPIGGDGGEIVLAEEAALRLDRAGDLGGDLALVEGARPLACDPPQGLAERRQFQPREHRWRLTIDQIVAASTLVGGERGDVARPVAGDTGVDGEAVFRIADRIREQPVEAARAEALRERLPGLDRARYGDRVRTVGRNLRKALLPVPARLRAR